MSKQIKLLGLAILALSSCAVLLSVAGCQSEDPAADMLQAQGVSSAPPEKAPAATPPAADAKSGSPAAGAAPSAGAPSAGAPATPPAADATAPADEAQADADKKPGPITEGEATGEAPSADAKAGAAEKDKGEGGIADDDRILNFKNLDPRQIILKKYDSMAAKHTRPWDSEKDPEDFIPETGRIDPLNPVNSAIPDELKPPRTGETDQNEIETYLISIACTAAVDQVRGMLQVRNVLKIGANKYVTIAMGEGPGAQGGTVSVGQSFSFFAGVVEFVPITCTITVMSASEDEVQIEVSAAGSGMGGGVSKTQVFIPRGYTG